MFLFLPETYKEKAEKEYNVRVRASVCFMLGCVALASAALVFPAYISAQSAEASAAADYAAASSSLASFGNQSADAVLSKAKTYAAAMETLAPLDADAIAQSITEAKGAGISITSISIGDTTSGVAVSVGGVAGTRNELIAFSRALQNDADFSDVVLPVDDLAGDTNIDYTISLSVQKQKQ